MCYWMAKDYAVQYLTQCVHYLTFSVCTSMYAGNVELKKKPVQYSIQYSTVRADLHLVLNYIQPLRT